MTIIAEKKTTDSKIIFNLPNKTEEEALKYAKDSLRKTVKERLNKRPWAGNLV